MALATSGVSATATPARIRTGMRVMSKVVLLFRQWPRQFTVVRVHDEHGEQLGGLRSARVRTHRVTVSRHLGEAFPGTIRPCRALVDTADDRSLEHRGIDECRPGVRVPFR